MEYPDEEDPYEYIERRFNEIEDAGIPEKEREIIYRIGEQIGLIGRKLESSDIEEAHQYVLRTLDVVCDLILKRKDITNKIGIIKNVTEYSEGVFQRIEEIESLLEAIREETNQLEAIVISEDVIDQMKNPKPNP